MEKKELIEIMLKKYNCISVRVVENLDPTFAGSICNLETKIIFDIENNQDERILLIQDVITKDNIHLYYEFMSDEDLKKYRIILGSLFNNRNWDIIKFIDDLNSNDKTNINFNLDWIEGTLLCTKNQVFGVKDTLKSIHEYIADIKESIQYKEYMNNKE